MVRKPRSFAFFLAMKMNKMQRRKEVKPTKSCRGRKKGKERDKEVSQPAPSGSKKRDNES